MLTAINSFGIGAEAQPLLPQPPELQPLWDWGIAPRQGNLIMVAGRSGSQKSGFTMFWCRKMGLETLYLSADNSPYEMTTRLIEIETGQDLETIEARIADEGVGAVSECLRDVPFTFSFAQPITFDGIEQNLDAYVEVHNHYPHILVVDVLMDIAGAESGYQEQVEAMQILASLARETGMTVIVIAHCTDKTDRAETSPGLPPSRKEIKNGLSEKPMLTLSVALWNDPTSGLQPELRVAALKQRVGPSDPTGSNYVRLIADPERTSFRPPAGH